MIWPWKVEANRTEQLIPGIVLRKFYSAALKKKKKKKLQIFFFFSYNELVAVGEKMILNYTHDWKTWRSRSYVSTN